VFRAHNELTKIFPELLLILVTRHPRDGYHIALVCSSDLCFLLFLVFVFLYCLYGVSEYLIFSLLCQIVSVHTKLK
jgi:hypothetical protein